MAEDSHQNPAASLGRENKYGPEVQKHTARQRIQAGWGGRAVKGGVRHGAFASHEAPPPSPPHHQSLGSKPATRRRGLGRPWDGGEGFEMMVWAACHLIWTLACGAFWPSCFLFGPWWAADRNHAGGSSVRDHGLGSGKRPGRARGAPWSAAGTWAITSTLYCVYTQQKAQP